MYPVLLQLGPLQLRSYGIVVLLSFLLGLWLSVREAKRKGFDPALIQDFAFYALLGGIIGARLYFVAFSEPAYYLSRPWEILAVWHGGLGIIGAVAGGFVVAVWYCSEKGISLLRFADALAPGALLGQAVGILACFLNGDSYGKPSDAAWAITYTDPRALAPLNVPLHPVEIYEMAAYLLAFAIVWGTRKRYRKDGFVLLTYLAAYGLARFGVEFFRGNPAIFAWGVPAAQVFAVALIAVAIAGVFMLGKPSERTS